MHVNVHTSSSSCQLSFAPPEYPEVGTRTEGATDGRLLLAAGPGPGPRESCSSNDWTPRIRRTLRHSRRRAFPRTGARLSVNCSRPSPPDEAQLADLDFLLTLGHFFELVVYSADPRAGRHRRARPGSPRADLRRSHPRLLRPRGGVLHGKPSSTQAQQEWALGVIRKPVVGAADSNGCGRRRPRMTEPTRCVAISAVVSVVSAERMTGARFARRGDPRNRYRPPNPGRHGECRS